MGITEKYRYLVYFYPLTQRSEYDNSCIYTEKPYTVNELFVYYNEEDDGYYVGEVKKVQISKLSDIDPIFLVKGYILTSFTNKKKQLVEELQSIQSNIRYFKNELVDDMLDLLTSEDLSKEVKKKKEKLIEYLKKEKDCKEKINALVY